MTNEKGEITCVRKHVEAFEKQARENAAAVREIEKGIDTVKAGIKTKTNEVEKAVAGIHTDIRAQERENAAAVNEIEKGIGAVKTGIKAKTTEIEKGAAEVVAGIRVQERENAAAVRAIETGVKQLERDTDKFIDLFYQGHVKKE